MYKDYMSYIKRIRDNLIQCGVSLPYNMIGDLEDPMELFRVTSAIDDILYYYKIMSIGGSNDALQGFFLPLDGYYKNKMRELAYQEFMDVVDSYAKLLGADSSSVDIGLNPSMWDDDYDEEDYEEEEYEADGYKEGSEGEYTGEESQSVRNVENPFIGRFQSLEGQGGTLPVREGEDKAGELETRDNVERVQGVTTPSGVGASREEKETQGVSEKNRYSLKSSNQEATNEERQDDKQLVERVIGNNGSEEREYVQTEDTKRGNGNTGNDTPKEPEKEDIGTDSEDFANLFSFDTDEISSDEELNNVINPLHSENTHSKNIFTGVSLISGNSVGNVSYEEHGVYLDDITLDTNNTVETDSGGYEEHGIYLDEIEISELDEVNTNSSPVENDNYVEHGTYLDELDISDGFEEPDDSWIEDDEEEEYAEDSESDEGFEEPEESWIEDDEEEEYADGGIQYDEDGFEIVEEESWIEDDEEEEEYVEDEGIQYDEDGFEIVDEPQWGDDDEEEEYVEDDGIQYDEDGFEIVEEESWIEDDEEDEGTEDYDSEGFEEVDDFGWGSSDDEDEEEIDEQPPQQIQATTTQQVVTPPMRNEAEEVDITDKLTEGTNKLLTSIKRGFAQFLSNQSQK